MGMNVSIPNLVLGEPLTGNVVWCTLLLLTKEGEDMKSFEYRIFGAGAGLDAQEELNRLGRDGWELVSAFKTVDCIVYVLKRTQEAL